MPGSVLQPSSIARAERLALPAGANQGVVQAQTTPPNMHLAGTDGWVHISAPAIPPFFPDNMAPQDPTMSAEHQLNCYAFGFNDVTGYNSDEVIAQKMRSTLTAPTFHIDQETDFTLQLTNLGLQIRPDLIDSHTIHFHGFRNAIP
ncbi:MAG: hypothetical protein GX616_20240, partial [Planctomycetes bacterium]|nr:hypothetical protein [Planctomycetota bacterium]